MLGFYEKRKLKGWMYSRPVLLVLLIVVGAMTFAAHGAYQKERETFEKREELAAQLGALEERSEKLAEDIENLEDPRGIEAELRQRYELGYEGEEAIVFVEGKEGEAVEEPLPEEPEGFWQRVKGWF
jgi:cell division protein FtsB